MTYPPAQHDREQAADKVIRPDQSALIARMGELDAEARQLTEGVLEPAPQVMERAGLRQQLALLSSQKGEQLHFLSEAAVLLEMALMEAGSPAERDRLAGQLGAVYLQFYQVTHEARYLTIAKQVLRPLSHSTEPLILLGLIRQAAFSDTAALGQHWIEKLLRLPLHQWTAALDWPWLSGVRQESWYAGLAARMH